VAVEGALLAAGLALYLGATRARNRRGSIGMWAFVAFLLLAYAANVLGPPPPGAAAIAVTALAGTVVSVLWLWWFDRNREPSGEPAPPVPAAAPGAG
jgi:hypothetical protein